jgi:hypothetical protein
MKKIFLLITVLGAFSLKAQYFPIMLSQDTVGCIVLTERGTEAYKFKGLSAGQESELKAAYPSLSFETATFLEEKLLANGMIDRGSAQKSESKFRRNKIMKNKRSEHFYRSGENIQLAMLSSFLSTSCALASSISGTPELYFASLALGVTAIYFQWSAGTELKKSAIEIAKSSNNH